MSRSAVRLFAVGCAALVVAVAAAGCGEREEPLGPGGSRQLELMLDWTPNPDHAGIYAAEGRGFFEQVGVDVKLRRPPDPSAPIKQAAANRVDLAISYEPEVLRARDEGVKVVAVAALIPRPLTSVISLPPNTVEDAQGLAGKKVGTAGIDYQEAFLDAMLDQAGVDPGSVERTNVGFDLNKALLTGKVDATLGGFINVETVALEERGKKPTAFTVDEAGIPPYDELVIVTSEQTLAKKGDDIRAFLGALARGTRVAERDPEAAADYIVDANPELEKDRETIRKSTEKTPFQPKTGKPFGYMDPVAWDEFAIFMREADILKRDPDAASAFTNDLIGVD
jgi:putative hydroxymethylpyrimidine transport system substrate-binding protein